MLHVFMEECNHDRQPSARGRRRSSPPRRRHRALSIGARDDPPPRVRGGTPRVWGMLPILGTGDSGCMGARSGACVRVWRGLDVECSFLEPSLKTIQPIVPIFLLYWS